MKWVRIAVDGKSHYGWVQGNLVQVTDLGWSDVLAGQPAEVVAQRPLGEVTLLSPVEKPGKIICIGLNYMDHIRETGLEIPKRPLIFSKFNTSITGPETVIKWSTALTDAVDYEAELVAVIGKTARAVSEDEALAYVAGYTAANDVSARDVQFLDGQWVRGKSLDTFCPIGPVFVTADEIDDPQNLAIACELNGEKVQDSNTKEMLFSVAELVTFCSHSFTLQPGDIILTGTPHGVGMGRNPKLYMKDGDEVIIEIEKIGRLRNVCQVVEAGEGR